MSWITKVRNSLSRVTKRETPDNLWIKCPSCSEMLFTKEYEENLSVCPRCEHHGRIGADARMAQLLDPGFKLLPAPKVAEDPLKFKDSKKYPDRLKAARAANPHNDALTNAAGAIEGRQVVLGEHPGDGRAVPVLLGVPMRHERGHHWITMGPGHQQIAQVAHRVRLDVVHVGQAAQHVRVQRLRPERVEVDVVGLQPSTADATTTTALSLERGGRDGLHVLGVELVLGNLVDPGPDDLAQKLAPSLAADGFGDHADRVLRFDEAECHVRIPERSRGTGPAGSYARPRTASPSGNTGREG